METWTKTCGPIPGGLIFTHTQVNEEGFFQPTAGRFGVSAQKGFQKILEGFQGNLLRATCLVPYLYLCSLVAFNQPNILVELRMSGHFKTSGYS